MEAVGSRSIPLGVEVGVGRSSQRSPEAIGRVGGSGIETRQEPDAVGSEQTCFVLVTGLVRIIWAWDESVLP